MSEWCGALHPDGWGLVCRKPVGHEGMHQAEKPEKGIYIAQHVFLWPRNFDPSMVKHPYRQIP